MAPRVIRDNATLVAEYENLSAADIVIGRVRIRPGEEHILLDLAARKVTLIPSAISQMCSRSKVFQAKILGKYMVPGTTPVYDRHDIFSLTREYGRKNISKVVCKLDRANGGQGVLLFTSIEDVYNNALLGVLQFPFVVQPYIEQGKDIRVVVLGDQVEAYTRENPDNFRQNLRCGGTSSPFKLSEDQLLFCRNIMRRAELPYAHIDILIDSKGNVWLSEVNLRGGLRGAILSQQDYLEATEKIHSQLLDHCLKVKERGSVM